MATFSPINLLINLNYDFETGDFTNWTASDASVETFAKHAGTYGAMLQASGSNVDGPLSAAIRVYQEQNYTYDSWHRIPTAGFTTGNLYVRIRYYSDLAGSVACSPTSSDDLKVYSAAQDSWDNVVKTVGAVGAGQDFEMPADCLTVRFDLSWWNVSDNPVGYSYWDDVSFRIQDLTISNLETYSVSRATEILQSRDVLAGGASAVSDLGSQPQLIGLVIRLLSDTDRSSLSNLIDACRASFGFNYTDDQSNSYSDCRFWFDIYDFLQTSYLRYEEDLLIRVEPS